MFKNNDHKATLAKLMATENITVIHNARAETASFNVEQRVLTLPVWAEMDGAMYDLLEGHEVGHALYTPAEGWHDAVHERGMGFKSFLNVIEDARIEKLVKRKYPGLSKSFANAYADLYKRDFFGIAKLNGNLSSLSLIDRINIYFKIGGSILVEFSAEERPFIDRANKLETWDDVMSLANDVYEFVQKNQDDKVQSASDLRDLIDQLEQQLEDNLDNLDSSESDSEETEEEMSDSSDGEDDETDSDSSQERGEEQGEEQNEEQNEVESVTDKAFRQAESQLVDTSAVTYRELLLPTINLNSIIIPAATTVNQWSVSFDEEVANYNQFAEYVANTVTRSEIERGLASIFHRKNVKYISLLVKEFEMRKNAGEYARALTAKTGDLDTRRLANYRFSNDMFRKVTVVPKGKSHGMVMFLDMSGSMNHNIANTVEQLLILTTFCQKVNIPFEVYGFSDGWYEGLDVKTETTYNQKVNLPRVLLENDSQFHLKHLLSSKMTPSEYRRSFNMLNCWSKLSNHWQITKEIRSVIRGFSLQSNKNNPLQLGGTPTAKTVLASRDIIEAFKSQTRVDIVNVIHLTDGEGDSGAFHYGKPGDGGWSYAPQKIVFVDGKTRRKILVKNTRNPQEELIQFVSEVTGCRHIGFYLTERQTVNRFATWANGSFSEENRKFARANGYFGAKSGGYNTYYYIDSYVSPKNEELVVDTTKTKNARGFANALTKASNSKHNSRILLSRFAKEIAG